MKAREERKKGTDQERYLAGVAGVCQEDARANINAVSTSSMHTPVNIYILMKK